jgi:UDP-N-acetylmuramoyl-tripeptide--D-alanyl-D-alanine ligase
MIAHALSKHLPGHHSRGNFNNELGLAIEMFRITSDDKVSVVELAMRGPGQIEYLSRIARPNIGVITNIGVSHIEYLHTRDNIAKAKSEIVVGMDSCSLLVLNADDKYFEFLRERAPGRVVSFGESEQADYRVTQLQLGKNGRPSFRLNGVPCVLEKCVGKHNAINAAAVFSVAVELKMKPEDIALQLADFEPVARRGKFSHSASGAIILDNTYNSAPDSLGASFETLADLKSKNVQTVAVVGDMLELGQHSIEAHERIGELAGEAKLSLLVTVGGFSQHIGKKSGMEAWRHFPDAVSAAEFLLNEVHKDDVVMIQGSRFMQLDTIVDALERGKLLDLPASEEEA